MEKESFQVCEWRIENFGCWNNELHGDWIISPEFVFGYASRMQMWPRYGAGAQLAVYLFPTSATPSSGGNLSFIYSDGSLLCTKRTHTEGWGQYIFSGLKFEEVVAKIKKKEDRLILRLCFVSEKSQAVTVSTTLDVLNLSIRIDPNSIESLESDDSKNISIIRYSKENVLDELLLKAVRKEETIEFVLQVLTKTVRAISVETHWSLQTTDKTVVRNDENKYLFRKCEPWKFSNSLMSELVRNGIAMLLSLKIINGDKIMKTLNDPQEISSSLKETVCFFDQSFIMSKDSTTSKKTADSVTALTKDLMCLYQDQDLSDMQLKCDNVTFPVHKVILSARSPVFKTMFLTDMKEVASGTVDIGDLDPSTLSRFLTYLYTGVLEEGLQSERALNLYYAADKYQVPSLKSDCADFLCSNVSIDNVCDILSFADKHKDDKLTAVSYNFVVNNYSEVLESEEWAGFMDSEPKLALKTVTEIGQKKHVGKIQKPF